VQARLGSRRSYARLETGDGWETTISPDLAGFIGEQISFFLATASAAGQPYIQDRGGPKGFLRVLDDHTLAFADFRGNRQYVSVGNAAGDDRAALIFVDYPRRLRLKLLGHLGFVELGDADAMLGQCASLPGYDVTVERIARIDVVAFDWNCPQHIPPR
jgi:predicted pyridoxine 5'-phosphate oxidase superfamily flavin-nucleotide-binding protein